MDVYSKTMLFALLPHTVSFSSKRHCCPFLYYEGT